MRFSVLTPTRDRRDWIQLCVRSVLDQTFEDWEQIVYDVGDQPVADLIPDDPRVKYHRGECRGPAADFQAALDLASGEIVTPLSDDDRLPRRALEIANREIGDSVWLNGRTVIVDQDGWPHHLRGGRWDHIEETRRGSYMLGGAVYWHKTLTDEIGGFDSAYDGAADFDLYNRFIQHSYPKLCKQVLYLYTDHEQTDTRMNRERQAEASRRIKEQIVA